MCDPVIIRAVTIKEFQTLKDKAKAMGIEIDAPAGHYSGNGFEVDYNYSSSTEQLTIHVTKEPAILSCGFINYMIGETIMALLKAQGTIP